MKQNKFIYLIIFSLVFLGFTSGVKAGCCYKDITGLFKYDGNVQTGYCQQAHPNVQVFDGISEDTCLAKNPNVINTNTGCQYDSELSTEAQCNSHAAQGFSWDKSAQCCKQQATTQAPTSLPSNYGNQNNNQSTSTDCNIPENICINDKHGTYANGCCSWTVSINNSTSDPDNNSAGDGSTTATSGTTGSDTMTIGFNCDDSNVQSLIRTIKTIYNLLKYVTPVILIIMGSIDFAKAVVAGKDDEIEKNKKRFMNRLFIAVLIFLLLSIFQLVTNIISSSGAANSNSWIDCWNK